MIADLDTVAHLREHCRLASQKAQFKLTVFEVRPKALAIEAAHLEKLT